MTGTLRKVDNSQGFMYILSMNKPKQTRNETIVKLKDKKNWSFSAIAKEYNITKQTAHEIYHREKLRQDLSTVKA